MLYNMDYILLVNVFYYNDMSWIYWFFVNVYFIVIINEIKL